MGAAPIVTDIVLTTLAMWWVVVGTVCVVRALPPFARWANMGIKPWACNLCMSFWTGLGAILTLVAFTGAWHTLVSVPALTGLGIATLARLTPPAPVSLPPLLEKP